MTMTVTISHPALAQCHMWVQENDDGATFTPGAWVPTDPIICLEPGTHHFGLEAGQSVIIFRAPVAATDLTPPAAA